MLNGDKRNLLSQEDQAFEEGRKVGQNKILGQDVDNWEKWHDQRTHVAITFENGQVGAVKTIARKLCSGAMPSPPSGCAEIPGRMSEQAFYIHQTCLCASAVIKRRDFACLSRSFPNNSVLNPKPSTLNPRSWHTICCLSSKAPVAVSYS